MSIQKNRQKKILLSFVNGYKEAEKIISAEKRNRLTRLTVESSLREYDNLCRLWEQVTKGADLKPFEKRRISFLIRQRQLFNKVGGYKKNL